MDNFIQFLGLVLFGFLFSVGKNYISTNFLFILWHFTGVILHEFSHYIVAFLLNGKPHFPNLIPKRQVVVKNGMQYAYWTLGYVESRNVNSFNAFFIGLAPFLILVPLAFYVYLNFFKWFEYNYTNIFLFYILEFLLLYNALPSKQDIKVALKGINGLIVLTFLIISGFLFEMIKD